MNDRHCEACGQVRLSRDVNHMNLIQLEAMALKHEQQIKDIAAHLLELKQLVTPMMEFKQPTNNITYADVIKAAGFYRKKEWVGLTEEEKHECYLKIDVWSRCVEAVEARLKEKNGGND